VEIRKLTAEAGAQSEGSEIRNEDGRRKCKRRKPDGREHLGNPKIKVCVVVKYRPSGRSTNLDDPGEVKKKKGDFTI